MIKHPELEKVETWCNIHDPSNVTNFHDDKPVFLSLMGGITPPATDAGATVTGSKVGEAKKNDKDFGDLIPTGGQQLSMSEYVALLDKFKSAPGTGCTTVMDMARITAGFNPLSPNLKGNLAAFDDYVRRIMNSPFFALNSSSRSEYKRTESNWNKAVDYIVGLYEGIEAKDKEKIKNSIKGMAEAASSRKDTTQTQNLFAQSTINFDKEIDVYIYSSTITIKESDGKTFDSKDTDIVIAQARLTFHKDLWPFYAEKVMNKHVQLIDAWLDDNTTKPEPGSKPAKLCIE